MTHSHEIEFLFDFLSPYSYVAWTQIHSLAKRFDHKVKPIPVLLAALLNSTGQKGPAEVPAERIYLIKDLSRTARALGIPLTAPPSHPFNPLLPLRLSTLTLNVEDQIRLVTLIFEAAWAKGKDITQPKELVPLVDQARIPGLSGEKALEIAQSSEAKARLRENTETAIQQGVFGVPTMRVRDELFWGFESFPNLERFLNGMNDVDPDLLEKWRTIKPSAQR